MASAAPGYCTFTATSVPSGATARWTWPTEAAATGIGSNRRNTRSGGEPSSFSTTSAASDGAIGGTSACSEARAARASSGSPSMTTEANWPSFINAPFIWPSSAATSAADRMANCSSRRRRRSSPPTAPTTRVAARSTPLRAVSAHTRDDRRSRARRAASIRFHTVAAAAVTTPTTPATAAARRHLAFTGSPSPGPPRHVHRCEAHPQRRR